MRLPFQCGDCDKTEAQAEMCRIRQVSFVTFGKKCPREKEFEPISQPSGSSVMTVQVQDEKEKDWFEELVEKLCRLIEVHEHDTLQIKHVVGKEILPYFKEKKFQKGTGKSIRDLANGIGWSNTEIYHCMKFATKYLQAKDAINELYDMSQTPTWHNVVHILLFKGKREHLEQPDYIEIPESAEGLPEELYETNVWILPEKRPDGYGSRNFRGNCDPTIIDQCLRRYLRGKMVKSVVLDPMAGSGTFIDVCKKLGIPLENIKAFDIKPLRKDIDFADALKMPIEDASIDLIFCHYPYWNLWKYSKHQDDLSNVDYLTFLGKVENTFKEFNRVLNQKAYLCILIGNKRERGVVDLEADMSKIGQPYFKLWDKIITVVSDPASHAHTAHGEWGIISERALRQNWTIQQYDTLLVFRK